MSNRTYRTLDGIRGMAALSIVILHMPRIFGPVMLPVASLAVDLFFCLSGFVLAHAYATRFDTGMSPARFMGIRFIRLYPLYLLGTVLGIVEAFATLRYQQGSVDWTLADITWSLPFSLLMIPTPGGHTLFPFNGVMWSIFFELVINLIWVLFWRPLASTRVLAGVVVASGVALLGFAFYRNSINLGTGWDTFLGGVARVSYGFFTGILIYRLKDHLRLPSLPPALLLVAVPLLFALPLPKPLQILAALFVLPWFVALGSKVEPAGILGKFCHAIGLASYAVYALHRRVFMLGYAFLLQFVHWDAQTLAPWTGLAFIALLVPACMLLDRIYDGPVRKLLTRIFLKRRESAPAETPSSELPPRTS